MSLVNSKKGDAVVLLGFTGIRLADFVISAADKKTVTIEAKNGELIFDRKTGVQTNVVEGKEKYANKLVTPDEAPKKKANKQAAKKAADKKPTAKKVEPEDDDDADDAEPPKKPAKKGEKPAGKAAAAGKNKKKAEPEDEDDDDEDYEEV